VIDIGAPVPKPGFGLSPRELDVLKLLYYGHTNPHIGKCLGITENTVKHHVTSLFNKTGTSNRVELVVFATHHGLL
jgi:two-component system nitrate/nitrite response regulator NarL